MRILILATLLTATSLPAFAQSARPIVRDGGAAVPNVSLRTPRSGASQAGTMQSGAMRAGTSWENPAAPMRADPPMTMSTTRRPAAPMSAAPMPAARMEVERTPMRTARAMDARATSGFNRYRGYRQIARGGTIPGYWSAPQYGINNYGHYGFDQPMAGTRWVRYYDDALLVDTNGLVHDGRYGMDFDRYGDRWGRDPRGVPMYVGDGDFRTQDRDYAAYERMQREGRDLSYDRDYPYDYRYGGQGRRDASNRGYDDRGYDDRDVGDGGYGDRSDGYRTGYTMVTETVTTTTSPSTVRYVARPATPARRGARSRRR